MCRIQSEFRIRSDCLTCAVPASCSWVLLAEAASGASGSICADPVRSTGCSVRALICGWKQHGNSVGSALICLPAVLCSACLTSLRLSVRQSFCLSVPVFHLSSSQATRLKLPAKPTITCLQIVLLPAHPAGHQPPAQPPTNTPTLPGRSTCFWEAEGWAPWLCWVWPWELPFHDPVSEPATMMTKGGWAELQIILMMRTLPSARTSSMQIRYLQVGSETRNPAINNGHTRPHQTDTSATHACNQSRLSRVWRLSVCKFVCCEQNAAPNTQVPRVTGVEWCNLVRESAWYSRYSWTNPIEAKMVQESNVSLTRLEEHSRSLEHLHDCHDLSVWQHSNNKTVRLCRVSSQFRSWRRVESSGSSTNIALCTKPGHNKNKNNITINENHGTVARTRQTDLQEQRKSPRMHQTNSKGEPGSRTTTIPLKNLKKVDWPPRSTTT